MRQERKTSTFVELTFLMAGYAVLFTLYLFMNHHIPFSYFEWNVNLPLRIYGVVFGAYLLTMPILCFAKADARKVLLFVLSLIFAHALAGRWVIMLYFAGLVFYILTYLRLAGFVKIVLCLLTYLSPLVWIITEEFNLATPFRLYLYLFITLFPLRFMLFFYHNIGTHFARESLLDYLNYIFFPTYFLIHPFTLIMPSYSSFTDSFSRGGGFMESAKSGMKCLVKGLTFLGLLGLLIHAIRGIQNQVGEDMIKLTLIIPYLWIVLFLNTYGTLILGFMKGLGCNLESPFHRSLLSHDVVDFFNRQLLHFKQFIVNIFYFPLLLATKSLNIYLSLLISTTLAVLFGGISYTVLGLGLIFCHMINFENISLSSAATEWLFNLDAFAENTQSRIIGLFALGIFLSLQQIYSHAIKYEANPPLGLKRIIHPLLARFLQIMVMLIVVTKLL